MSIATRAPIVATVVTLLFIPVKNEDGKVLGHSIRKHSTHHLRCVPGKQIPATPLAKRLALEGDPCQERIVRKVRVTAAP